MKTNVKAVEIDLTEALSDYIDEKVGQIEKFLDPTDESIMCDVEIGMSTKAHQSGEIFRAEFNLITAGNKFFAESEKGDLYIAINDAKEQISEAVKAQRNKERQQARKGGSVIKNLLKFGKK